MEEIRIIKVGGAVVEDELQLARLLDTLSKTEGRKVLVHGGGRKATKMAARLGMESRMVAGRRITDAEMLEVVTMVYGGLVNKTIVARMQAYGINALGFTGADINAIRSHRRAPVSVGMDDGTQQTVDYGFVGDVDSVDGKALSALIEQGITLVIAPLTHDGEGHLLNTNADTIAGETAKALARLYDVTLVYAFEKKGVLSNPDDDDSVIPVMRRADFERMVADGTIAGGMIPKIDNALAAVDAGVRKVVITSADNLEGGTILLGGSEKVEK